MRKTAAWFLRSTLLYQILAVSPIPGPLPWQVAGHPQMSAQLSLSLVDARAESVPPDWLATPPARALMTGAASR